MLVLRHFKIQVLYASKYCNEAPKCVNPKFYYTLASDYKKILRPKNIWHILLKWVAHS